MMSHRFLPVLGVLVLVAGHAACGTREAGRTTSGGSGSPSGEASADPVASLASQGPLFPMQEGLRWTYAARSAQRRWEVRSKRVGGDVRERDGRDIRYAFLYSDLDDERRDMMKSIYALPPEGPEEFHVDAFHFRLHHDPPVPLLPSDLRRGVRWTWAGRMGAHEGRAPDSLVRTQLEVRGVETVETDAGRFETVRVDEMTDDLRITRWFAPGTGMVRMVVKGTLHGRPIDFEMTLTSFSEP